ncbi:MAG: oligoendopeptidase F [Lentisphaeria bacterium]|nr:oligoendopeptidase F [Lentisphaeria bacterium]
MNAPAAGAESLPAWDLEAIYASPADWEADFSRIRPLAEAFAAYRGRLAESPETLAAAIAALDEFERLGDKVNTYAHLRADENTGHSGNRARSERVSSLFAELSEISAWFEPEVMAIPSDRMTEFLASPALAFYRRSLEELLREREHTLSEPEERVLGMFSDVLSAPEHIYSLLNDADLSFGRIAVDGKRVTVTQGNYRRLLESPDRKVRHAAFQKMLGAYHKTRNTCSATLDAAIRSHVISARLRKYPSALAASLAGDNIPETVYRGLIEAVHSQLGHLHRYAAFRRQKLGLERLDMYDLSVPLEPGVPVEYSWREAAEMVRAALAPLGGDYGDALELAFRQRWIDAPERKGKASGAYSGGCYDTYPYLLLNFCGTLDDVFTLAHELGHSLHSYHTNRTQAYHYSHYGIFLAEVASTTNEILLSEYLMAQTGDPAMRRYLIAHLLDELRGTIYRQTQFAEFELMIHELAAAGEPLTPDLLDERYYELNGVYYGPELADADPLIASEWARIPHFYYDFYVFQYATSMSAAIQLAAGLLSGDTGARKAYLDFLRSGDSCDALETLKRAGVDLSTPAPVTAALDYFGSLLTRLEAGQRT